MFKHLLVPVDGSELSDRAAQTAISLAATLGARITGFVAEPLPPMPNESSGMAAYTRTADEHRARTEAHARGVLAAFGKMAAEQGVAFHGEYKRTDAIDDAIVEAAKVFEADLVVMVTHGRGAFGEFLYGSQTKAVLSGSRLPLLVLH